MSILGGFTERSRPLSPIQRHYITGRTVLVALKEAVMDLLNATFKTNARFILGVKEKNLNAKRW